ncbi:MAG: sugar phosphate isomerase/epimerase [Armatimonadetes bacterium]|nr:sugar phosphate isomerase/epimerase [Armatimonadota bacterium]
MKLACQEGLVPGRDLQEKLDNLAAWGYEGIEFWGAGLQDRVDEINRACDASDVKPSTICAGFRGTPLDSDPEQREIAIEDCKMLLKVAADLGAVGLIFVPIFGGPRIPDLSPLADAVTLEKQLLVELGKILGDAAAEAGSLLLLEPLNRYETHLLNRLEQAVEICQQVDNPHVKIMADFFHMNIEEPVIEDSLRQNGEYIAHVHLADSLRWLPGYGHTDFRAGFQALQDIGFEGYMALECRVPGPPEEDLPRCAEFLRAQMP